MDPSSSSDAPSPCKKRVRRTTSLGYVEDITKLERRIRSNQPDQPLHVYCDSLLSWSSNFTEFTGIINWAFTLLLLGGARLCLENIHKYGILIDTPQLLLTLNGGPFTFSGPQPFIYSLLYLPLHACIALGIEKLLANNLLTYRTGYILICFNLLFILFFPGLLILFGSHIQIIGISVLTLVCVIMCLKLISYAHVNKWCRDFLRVKRRFRSVSHSKSDTSLVGKWSLDCLVDDTDCQWSGRGAGEAAVNDDEGSAPHMSSSLHREAAHSIVSYPNNLCVQNILYFMLVPTLCYELNFPYTKRVRMWFLGRRILETIVWANVLFASFQQWIIPVLNNSLQPFSTMDFVHIIERLLKLAVPNHLLWLIIFYLFFHSLLNLTGEILRFGDRKFYLDWWNADDISVFWRKWNIPAHRFAIRHIYMPLIRHGFTRCQAFVAVFLISALLHEYLVAVPLRLMRAWAFIGIMFQIPMAILTDRVRRSVSSRLSNILVWITLIVGQPLAVMMYYHDYIVTNKQSLLHSSISQ